MNKITFYLPFCIILFTFCTNNSPNKKKDIIGKINEVYIYSSDIEKLMQQEIFDQLNSIYNIKSKTLDTYIDLKILEQEAINKNLTVENYTNTYVAQKIKSIGIDSLSKLYGLENRIKFHGLNMSVSKKESLDDKTELKYNIKASLIRSLIDSLRKDITIEKYIYPPKSPNIELDDLVVYYRGNKDSNVTFYTISDYDCNKCIETYPLLDSLYTIYKDKVKFGYINFSSTPTLAQMAANAANKQNKFWNFHDSLYCQKKFIDSTIVFNLAKQLNLNMEQFNKDLINPQFAENINKTINKLVEKGIFATPTIVINKRLIYNSASLNEISYLIEKELNKE